MFSQLRHNSFLTALCQLKWRRFELPSLIWNLYL
jgi:hypothetical protein